MAGNDSMPCPRPEARSSHPAGLSSRSGTPAMTSARTNTPKAPPAAPPTPPAAGRAGEAHGRARVAAGGEEEPARRRGARDAEQQRAVGLRREQRAPLQR